MAASGICVVPGCAKPIKRKRDGLCNAHMLRLQRYGDVRASVAARVFLPSDTPCGVPGCANLNETKGLCGMHYQRLRFKGDVGGPDPRKAGTCAIEGCGRNLAQKGLCAVHATRLKRHGDAMHGGPIRRKAPKGTLLPWLHANVSHACDECLIWPFSRDSNGYGGITYKGADTRAHVVMCELVNGLKPSAAHVAAHSCGRGHDGCVNPNHLRWATALENAADKVSHGTQPAGSQIWNAILSEEDVRWIRENPEGLRQKDMALRLGVGRSSISAIVRRKQWRCVT